MRLLLIGEEAVPFVDEAGRAELDRLRAEWRSLLRRDRSPIVARADTLRVHTFAGGRINATLAAIIEGNGTARVAGWDDLDLDLRGPKGAGFAPTPYGPRCSASALRTHVSRLARGRRSSRTG